MILCFLLTCLFCFCVRFFLYFHGVLSFFHIFIILFSTVDDSDASHISGELDPRSTKRLRSDPALYYGSSDYSS